MRSCICINHTISIPALCSCRSSVRREMVKIKEKFLGLYLLLLLFLSRVKWPRNGKTVAAAATLLVDLGEDEPNKQISFFYVHSAATEAVRVVWVWCTKNTNSTAFEVHSSVTGEYLWSLRGSLSAFLVRGWRIFNLETPEEVSNHVAAKLVNQNGDRLMCLFVVGKIWSLSSLTYFNEPNL